nr:MAG TPA: hypothetical protein [Caudoviricetes sp.]
MKQTVNKKAHHKARPPPRHKPSIDAQTYIYRCTSVDL